MIIEPSGGDDALDLRPAMSSAPDGPSSRSIRTMERILAGSAIGEAITGTALVAYPQFVVRLLLSAEIVGAAMVVSRIAGIALIGLSLACWPVAVAGGARNHAYGGMLAYSALTACCLTWVGFADRLRGPLLWPAAVVHVGLTAALLAAWSTKH